MKKFNLDHPSVLKGFLAVALLANLSYSPLFRQTESINLSSNADSTTSGGDSTPSGDSVASNDPTKCDPKADPTLKSDACQAMLKIRDRLAQDPIQGSSKVLKTKPIPDTVSKVAVKAARLERSGGLTPPPRPSKSSLESSDCSKDCVTETHTTDEDIKSIMNALQPAIDAAVAAATQPAGQTAPAGAPASSEVSSVSTTTTVVADEPPVKSIKEIADGLKTCSNDKKGAELSEIDELTCQTHRLSRLGDDSNGRHERDQAEDRIDKLFVSIRKSIKDLYESGDPLDKRKADNLVARASSAIESADFKSSTKADKLVAGLDGLKAGMELKSETADLKSQVDDMKKDFSKTFNQWTADNTQYQASCRAGYCDSSLLADAQEQMAHLQELQSAHSDLADQIAQTLGESASDLSQYKSGLSTNEYAEYTRGAQKIETEMTEMVAPKTYSTANATAVATTNLFGNQTALNSQTAAFGNTALGGVQPNNLGNLQNMTGLQSGSPFLNNQNNLLGQSSLPNQQSLLGQPSLVAPGPAVYIGAQQQLASQRCLSTSNQTYNSLTPFSLTNNYSQNLYPCIGNTGISNSSGSPFIH